MIILNNKKRELNRPVIKIELEPVDWILELLALIALISFFGYILYQFSSLPEIIPTHFNVRGEADEFGNKSTLWMLQAIGVVIYIILSFLARIPEKFNYPVVITLKNAPKQYAYGIRLIRYLKLAVILVFFYIGFISANIAKDPEESLGNWFLPVVISFIIIPVIVYFIVAQKNK